MTDFPRLPTAFRLIDRDVVDSTNAIAKTLAEEGAEDGVLVWGRRQTAGRGRHGRDWASPEGNLYLSLICRPGASADKLGQLSFVTAVAVAEALEPFLPAAHKLELKWPNDVLIDGGKVTGILLESSMSADGSRPWVVIGVGINIAHHPESTDSTTPPTSLKALGEVDVRPERVLEAFAERFSFWRRAWLGQGFAPVRAAWLRRAYRLGVDVTARLAPAPVTGRFVDLDESGAMILDGADGRRRVTAGEVFFPTGAEGGDASGN